METSHLSLLIRREFTDIRRQRRVFRLLFLQPLIFIALISAPALLVQRAAARERASVFTVAAEGDVDALPGLAAALDRPPLRLTRTGDAARRLTSRSAQVGLVVADGAAGLVAAGKPVPVHVLTFSTQDASERAGPLLVGRLADYRAQSAEKALRAAGAPPEFAAPLILNVDDVATTSAEGLRFGLAQALPVLLVVQLFGLTTVAEERLAGAKDRRVLEPLLLLPYRRSELLVGIGSASATIGAFSAVIVFVPLTLLASTAVAAVGRSLAGPVEVATTLVIGAASLALVFTAFGLLLGARASSSGEGSVFVTVTQLAVFAVIAASPFLASVAAEGPILLAPILGPLLFVRDGVAQGFQTQSVLLVVASTLVLTRFLGGAAVRRLDDERSVLRSTR